MQRMSKIIEGFDWFLRNSLTRCGQLFECRAFGPCKSQPIFLFDMRPKPPVFTPESLVWWQPLMRRFVGFSLIGGVVDNQQVIKVVGESAPLRARPVRRAMPMRVGKRDNMVDVDIGCAGKGFAGVWSGPQSGFHCALPRVFESDGYLAGGYKQFLARVTAVPVCVDPMRPVFTLIRRVGQDWRFERFEWLCLFDKQLTPGQRENNEPGECR